jgi:hypothetical protein
MVEMEGKGHHPMAFEGGSEVQRSIDPAPADHGKDGRYSQKRSIGLQGSHSISKAALASKYA